MYDTRTAPELFFFFFLAFGNNPSLGQIGSTLETQKEYKMKERKLKQKSLCLRNYFVSNVQLFSDENHSLIYYEVLLKIYIHTPSGIKYISDFTCKSRVEIPAPLNFKIKSKL